MYYELNVSKDGTHFFATADRSITTEEKLQQIGTLFLEKFPEEEGYKVTATRCEHIGTSVALVGDRCPECGQLTVRTQDHGGVECTSPGCDYWFCF